MTLAMMKAFQEYALLGRSRTSYRSRWVMKCGWIYTGQYAVTLIVIDGLPVEQE
jgi:hypothetical protein